MTYYFEESIMKQKDIWVCLLIAGLVMILGASELSQWFSRIFANPQRGGSKRMTKSKFDKREDLT